VVNGNKYFNMIDKVAKQVWRKILDTRKNLKFLKINGKFNEIKGIS
jgi:hypothetical protein